jgi:hypothetical protein
MTAIPFATSSGAIAPLARAVWAFWCRPVRAEPLALFRIFIGLILLGSQLTSVAPFLALCGPGGPLPAKAVDDWLRSSGRFCLLRGPVSLPLLGDWLPPELSKSYPWLDAWVPPGQAQAWSRWGEEHVNVYLFFGVYLTALACLTVGLFTRPATVVAVLLAATFHHRLPWLTNAGDRLARDALYFLVFAPSGAAYSIDRLLRRRSATRRARIAGLSPPDPTVALLIAPWSVRLIQIQVCFLYMFNGLAKLGDIRLEDGWVRGDWVSGEALYWVLNNISLCRWPYGRLPLPLELCRLLSWGVLLFEIGFSFFVLVRPLRRWLILAGLAFHLGIFAFLEVGWLTPVVLSWYSVFLPGEGVRAFFDRLALRPRGQSPAAPSAGARVGSVSDPCVLPGGRL